MASQSVRVVVVTVVVVTRRHVFRKMKHDRVRNVEENDKEGRITAHCRVGDSSLAGDAAVSRFCQVRSRLMAIKMNSSNILCTIYKVIQE